MRRGYIAVDFDKTLATHHGGPDVGKPIAPMVKRVKQLIARGQQVKVLSARASTAAGRRQIGDWTEQHLGRRLQATNKKTPGMIKLYDDRAVGVVPNRGTLKNATKAKKKR